MKMTGMSRSGMQVRAKALRSAWVFGAWKDAAERGQASDWLAFMLSCSSHCSKHLMWNTSSNPHSNPMRYSVRVSILQERKIESQRCEHVPSIAPGNLACPCYSCDLLIGGLRAMFAGRLCGLCWPKCWPPMLAHPQGTASCWRGRMLTCVCSCVHTTLTSRRSGGACSGEYVDQQ